MNHLHPNHGAYLILNLDLQLIKDIQLPIRNCGIDRATMIIQRQ